MPRSPIGPADYGKHLKHIEVEFGDFPVAALADRRTRGEFLAWRDRVGRSSERTADYRFAILARMSRQMICSLMRVIRYGRFLHPLESQSWLSPAFSKSGHLSETKEDRADLSK